MATIKGFQGLTGAGARVGRFGSASNGATAGFRFSRPTLPSLTSLIGTTTEQRLTSSLSTTIQAGDAASLNMLGRANTGAERLDQVVKKLQDFAARRLQTYNKAVLAAIDVEMEALEEEYNRIRGTLPGYNQDDVRRFGQAISNQSSLIVVYKASSNSFSNSSSSIDRSLNSQASASPTRHQALTCPSTRSMRASQRTKLPA